MITPGRSVACTKRHTASTLGPIEPLAKCPSAAYSCICDSVDPADRLGLGRAEAQHGLRHVGGDDQHVGVRPVRRAARRRGPCRSPPRRPTATRPPGVRRGSRRRRSRRPRTPPRSAAAPPARRGCPAARARRRPGASPSHRGPPTSRRARRAPRPPRPAGTGRSAWSAWRSRGRAGRPGSASPPSRSAGRSPRSASAASRASISTKPSVAWVWAPHQSSGTGGTTAAASSFLTSRLPTCGPLPWVITTSTSCVEQLGDRRHRDLGRRDLVLGPRPAVGVRHGVPAQRQHHPHEGEPSGRAVPRSAPRRSHQLQRTPRTPGPKPRARAWALRAASERRSPRPPRTPSTCVYRSTCDGTRAGANRTQTSSSPSRRAA